MQTRKIIGGGAIALAVIIAGYMTFASAQPYGPWGGGGYGPGMMGGWGSGMMGPGMMHGWGPGMGGWGPGMMGGYGPGMMGPWGDRSGDLKLSTDDVKSRFERWIAWHGNPRIKIGEVKERDENTIEVDIVTQDNSLVDRFIVDRRTGFWRPDRG